MFLDQKTDTKCIVQGSSTYAVHAEQGLEEVAIELKQVVHVIAVLP